MMREINLGELREVLRMITPEDATDVASLDAGVDHALMGLENVIEEAEGLTYPGQAAWVRAEVVAHHVATAMRKRRNDWLRANGKFALAMG